MDNLSARKTYLAKIGVKHDPFITPVAEQEIQNETGDMPLFFSFYTSPEKKQFQWGIRELRREQHGLIYGNPGDGKTTLRLGLEANCRIMPEDTLVVTYLLGEDIQQALTLTEHGARLAQAVSIDLIIQIIEQLTPARLKCLSEHRTELETILTFGGAFLQRMLKTLAEDVSNEHFTEESASYHRAGLGIYWKRVGRYPVRYVEPTETLREFLRLLPDNPDLNLVSQDGFDLAWKSLQIVKQWGYQRVFVLVDGVDTRQRIREQMAGLVFSLIKQFPQAEAEKVYFKLFLPLEIQANVDEYISKTFYPNDLPSIMQSATIKWSTSALRQLLIQRFRASGAQTISSLDILADPELKNGLERPLMRMAKGSPRRLLALISLLIDAHADRDPNQVKINQADWEKMRGAVKLLAV